MNRSPTAGKRSRVAERLLALALLGLGSGVSARMDPWPAAPPDEGVVSGRAASGSGKLDDYRYAAGLYLSLEESHGKIGSSLRGLEGPARERLLRALLSQGKTDRAAALAAKDEDLPAELRFQARLAKEHAEWKDLDFEEWHAAFSGEDGESLYWLARLELMRGNTDQARELIGRLLSREAGSVFAPAALELLEGIPKAAAPAASEPKPVPLPGFRVQWGAFKNPMGARRLCETLVAYGQAAEILSYRKDGIDLYRVCSPVYGDKERAREAGELVRTRYGLDFVILAGPSQP